MALERVRGTERAAGKQCARVPSVARVRRWQRGGLVYAEDATVTMTDIVATGTSAGWVRGGEGRAWMSTSGMAATDTHVGRGGAAARGWVVLMMRELMRCAALRQILLLLLLLLHICCVRFHPKSSCGSSWVQTCMRAAIPFQVRFSKDRTSYFLTPSLVLSATQV